MLDVSSERSIVNWGFLYLVCWHMGGLAPAQEGKGAWMVHGRGPVMAQPRLSPSGSAVAVRCESPEAVHCQPLWVGEELSLTSPSRCVVEQGAVSHRLCCGASGPEAVSPQLLLQPPAFPRHWELDLLGTPCGAGRPPWHFVILATTEA